MSEKKDKLKSKATILIVEDNKFMAELMIEKVANRGIDSIVAEDGEDALKSVNSDKPDLVLMDMPLSGGKDGFSVISEIRRDFDKSKLPIICLFKIHDEESIKRSEKADINSYLIKSESSTDEIVNLIEQTLKGENVSPPKKEAGIEKEKSDKAQDGLKVKIPEQASKQNFLKAAEEVKIRIEKVLKSPESDISIIELVDDIIEYSFLTRSSDIHLEPYEAKVIARLRIDGMLKDVFDLPKGIQSGVTTRIKVLAGMRTDEHQTAQDGRFKISLKGFDRKFDIRVSIIPTYFGENAVLRLLAEQTKISTLDDLALTSLDKQKIREAARKPYGMILATGPTGSGKSTTLYTVLRELNAREVQIITIEDPIEYSVEGIDQIQVNNRTGLTFANGLRSILRQDPNVIMVGEIRDEETASIAVNAALTGHKLLSTLHTNDAATTLPRLLDMGIEPFLVASTINIAIGQRLVRVLCQTCKEKRKLTEAEFKSLSEVIPAEILGNNREFYFPKGCDICGHNGYFDRMGIYEILEINDFVRDAIVRRADASEIKKIAVKNGMITLLEDGFRKALAGYTSIEEILRVVHE